MLVNGRLLSTERSSQLAGRQRPERSQSVDDLVANRVNQRKHLTAF